SCLCKVSQLFSINRNIILAQPITEQDWSLQGLLLINRREMLQCNTTDCICGPEALFLGHETVFEKSKGFVSPDTDEAFDCKGFEWLKGFIQTTDPSSKFTRRVDVVGLDLWCKSLLRFEIELDHCLGKWIRVTRKSGNNLEYGRIES